MNKDVNLAGQRFGNLTAISKMRERLRNEIAWLCKCDCGNETIATRGQLIRGHKKSCGCLRKKTPPNALDLAGQRFGKLVAIEQSGTTKNQNMLWLCQCDCGNTTLANATTLRRGETISCGCERQTQITNARKILQNEKSVDGVSVPLLTKKVRSDSSTGHKGVYKRVRNGKVTYEANIKVKGKRHYAGPYVNLNDAIAARKQLEEKYHKPYIDALNNETPTD